MSIAFDQHLLAVLAYHMAQLGEVISLAEEVDDEMMQSCYEEALIFDFVSCEQVLHDLLLSVRPSKPTAKTMDPFTQWLKANVLTQAQINAIGKMNDAADVFYQDAVWLDQEDEQRDFRKAVEEIPQWYEVLLLVVRNIFDYMWHEDEPEIEDVHEIH